MSAQFRPPIASLITAHVPTFLCKHRRVFVLPLERPHPTGSRTWLQMWPPAREVSSACTASTTIQK
jgi:hypothetical protein